VARPGALAARVQMGTRPVGLSAWRGEATALSLLGLAWAALWLLTVPLGEFPLNDDWVYALAVRSIVETRRYALPSPATANVFAQAYWGALFCLPFGFSFTALRVSTCVLGMAGVLTLYLLLRELGGERRLAAIGALTLAVNPLYLCLSTSFMTDVPFTALVTASLWLYVRGVKRGSAASIGGAFAVAFAAILVRQFALMLPLAFGVAHLLRKGPGLRSLAIAALPLLLGAALHVGYERWVVSTGRTPLVFSPVSSLRPASFVLFGLASLQMTVRALPYIGLFVTPFAACFVLARRAPIAGLRALTVWLGSMGLGVVLLLLLRGAVLPVIGNILLPSGLGPLTLRDTYLLGRNLPDPSWLRLLWPAATAWGALVTGFVLVVAGTMLVRVAGAALRSWDLRPAWPQALLLTIIGAYAAGLFVIGYQAFWFDRYLILFIPPVLGLLVLAVGGSAPRAVAPAAAVLGLYALFSVLGTHDYLAWNRARWRALADLQASGVSPRQIDGGYEFNGWLLYDPRYEKTTGKSWWWVQGDEYMIASGPMPGYAQVASYPFDRWLIPGRSEVLALRRE